MIEFDSMNGNNHQHTVDIQGKPSQKFVCIPQKLLGTLVEEEEGAEFLQQHYVRRLKTGLPRDVAEKACAEHKGDAFEACVLDVHLTGDVAIAQAGSY